MKNIAIWMLSIGSLLGILCFATNHDGGQMLLRRLQEQDVSENPEQNQ